MNPEMLKSLVGGLVLDNLQLREENTRLKSMLSQASKGMPEPPSQGSGQGVPVVPDSPPPIPVSSGS